MPVRQHAFIFLFVLCAYVMAFVNLLARFLTN